MCTLLESKAHVGQPNLCQSQGMAEFVVVALTVARGNPSTPKIKYRSLLEKDGGSGARMPPRRKAYTSEGHERKIEAPLERQRLFDKVGKGRRLGRSPDGRVG